MHIFFREEMLYQLPGMDLYSNFFNKPKMLLSKIVKKKLAGHFVIRKKWEPFQAKDFYIAHSKEYVDAFFQGKELLCSTNGVPWSSHFVESVRYMNSSLYSAILYAIQNPGEVTICPTGGFVRATPEYGNQFCTFSGQVIAALKLMNSLGKKGSFIDLVSFSSSAIPQSRKYFFDNQVDNAIHSESHICPNGEHEDFLKELAESLEILEKNILEKKVDYLLLTHGADAHEWDDFGSKCTTEEWLKSSAMVLEMVKSVNQKLDSPLPLILCLEGGFRWDSYSNVIELFLADICQALDILFEKKINYKIEIKSNKYND